MAEELTSKTLEELTTLGYQFETYYSKKYGSIFVIDSKKLVICELTQGYVPIEKFKKIFGKLGEVIKERQLVKFIFDKRQLKAFHQPSMEWYFVEWKEEMFHAGMYIHRKILPAEAWFGEAVRAGRAKILQDYPQLIINQLDIQYRDTLKEAIEE